MSSEESSSQDQENNSDQENDSKPQENNEANSVTNESTERIKGKDKDKDNKLLGKKTEREGKKTNNDYCSSCLKKGKLFYCEECEKGYHKKCLKLEDKEITNNKKDKDKEINKKDKDKEKNKFIFFTQK